MRVAFVIQAWAAAAPGLATSEAWLRWAQKPFLPQGSAVPELPNFPAMMRRRLGRLGRFAVAAVDDVIASAATTDIPIVWASRYGEVSRSLELLFDQARGQPLSPTAFSLSVHNAIGAQHAIARQIRANAVCIAAGPWSAEAGVMEAVSLLHDGAEAVVLVCHEAPLPDGYHRFEDGPACEYAWAMRLALPSDDGAQPIMLERHAHVFADIEDATAHRYAVNSDLPSGLSVLRYLIAGEGTWQRPDAQGVWQWRHEQASH